MPCTTFSKCIQSDEVDILGALNALLKTLWETDKLASKPLDQWPTYAATLAKCASEGGDTVYQLQKLKRYPQAAWHDQQALETYPYSVQLDACCRHQISILLVAWHSAVRNPPRATGTNRLDSGITECM